MTKEWYSAQELAGFPGMPKSAEGVHVRAGRGKWKSREVKAACRGGKRREYLAADVLKSLPGEERDGLQAVLLGGAPTFSPPVVDVTGEIAAVPALRISTALAPRTPMVPALRPLSAPPAVFEAEETTHLKRWQRQVMTARVALLVEVERRQILLGSTDKAVGQVVALAKSGQLSGGLQDLVAVANARRGGNRTLCRGTLYAWIKKRQTGGTVALAPKDVEKDEVPVWASALVEVYNVPQKVSIGDALERLGNGWVPGYTGPIPSAPQVRRFLKKRSALDRERGRKTGSELRSQRAYAIRETGSLQPFDVVTLDGHTVKATVAHPKHKRAFSPEMCAAVDYATRYCAGWSIGLSETTETVGDCLRDVMTVREGKPVGAIPAILYTDNGSGEWGKVNADELTGRYARLGITFTTGIPGNPQGRGAIERFQQSCWFRLAKKLPTYRGKDMDRNTSRKVYKLVDKQLKAEGSSPLLTPWAEVIRMAQAEIDAYNHRPHRSLPKITDSVTGLRRHLTPTERLAQFIEAGWRPTLPAPGELADVARPQMRVNVRRGRLNVFGNYYGAPELEHYEGEMIVEYDIHDAATVRVRDPNERLVCIARFDYRRGDVFPKPAVQVAVEQRDRRRTKVLERKLEEVKLEAAWEEPREAEPLSAEAEEKVAALLARTQAKAALVAEAQRVDLDAVRLPVRRPNPSFPHGWERLPRTDQEKYEWLCALRTKGEAINDDEEEFIRAHEAHYFMKRKSLG